MRIRERERIRMQLFYYDVKYYSHLSNKNKVRRISILNVSLKYSFSYLLIFFGTISERALNMLIYHFFSSTSINWTLFSGMDCANGGLIIHDGSSHNAPVLARLCGHRAKNTLYSTTNMMFIKADNLTIRPHEKVHIMYEAVGKIEYFIVCLNAS